MSLVIYSDGGSRGNPGPSAYAIVVTRDGKIIHEQSEYLGINTNNYAEYRGLIAGMSKAIELKEKNIECVMDSELVIKQMRGEYKVKAPNIIDLYRDAKAISQHFDSITFTHVKRENRMIPRADQLVNEEMDRHAGH